MGSIIADIVIVLIFVLSTIHAYRQGLNSLIYQIVSWLITIVALFVLCTPITNIVVNHTGFDEMISSKIETVLKDNFESNLEEGTEIKDSNMSSSVTNMINNYIAQAKDKAVENTAGYVADQISYIVVFAVVVIVIFTFVRIISSMLKFVLDFVVCIPGISALNRVGGIIYGLVRAFITVYIILAVLSLISPLIANSGIISAIKDSNICSIFYNDNIILKFLS